MKTKKRKLEIENAFGQDWWCTACAACVIPPELWVAFATYMIGSGYE
jgi:hypothetical protein